MGRGKQPQEQDSCAAGGYACEGSAVQHSACAAEARCGQVYKHTRACRECTDTCVHFKQAGVYVVYDTQKTPVCVCARARPCPLQSPPPPVFTSPSAPGARGILPLFPPLPLTRPPSLVVRRAEVRHDGAQPAARHLYGLLAGQAVVVGDAADLQGRGGWGCAVFVGFVVGLHGSWVMRHEAWRGLHGMHVTQANEGCRRGPAACSGRRVRAWVMGTRGECGVAFEAPPLPAWQEAAAHSMLHAALRERAGSAAASKQHLPPPPPSPPPAQLLGSEP